MNTYDAVPLLRSRNPYFDPRSARFLAAQYGVTTPSPARVLDIGCGTGADAAWAAAVLPQAQVVAVDPSEVQIAHLPQAENLQGVVGDIASIEQSYDLVLCRDLWSYLAPSNTAKLPAALAKATTDNGLVAISYDTLPGWHMLGLIRDMMRFHLRDQPGGPGAVAKARELVRFMAREPDHGGNAWGAWLSTTEQLLTTLSDPEVYHGFLSGPRQAFHFHDVVSRMSEAGLYYVCELNLASSLPENAPEEVFALLEAESAQGDRVHVQQVMDYLRNKRQRASLFSRKAPSELAFRFDSALVWRAGQLRPDGLVRGRSGFVVELSKPAQDLYQTIPADTPVRAEELFHEHGDLARDLLEVGARADILGFGLD